MSDIKLPPSFIDYYQSLVGSLGLDFPTFISSLTETRNPVLLINPPTALQLKKSWQDSAIPWNELSWFPNAIEWPSTIPLGTTLPGYFESQIYPLNQSSLLPVYALGQNLTGIFLDACASPGGKTLACFMSNPSLQIFANESSPARYQKLAQTINSWHLNFNLLRYKAQLIHTNFPEVFDFVLADVPCSSESHVLKSPKYLKMWNPNRIKSLVSIQFSIISGLIRALKVGGTLIYSTCAINQSENELIIHKLLSRYSNNLSLEKVELPIPSSPGLAQGLNLNYDHNSVRRIWPHLHNQDPMFIAKIRKTKQIVIAPVRQSLSDGGSVQKIDIQNNF